MSDFEKRKIDSELREFTSKNFERPADCKNSEQIRFYISELGSKIIEIEGRFSYVPSWAYTLLAQYNAKQNSLIHAEFRNTYR
jgi:hypothetical protein